MEGWIMTVKMNRYQFDYPNEEFKIVYIWIIDGNDIFKLIHYIDNEPSEWKSEWELEIPDIDMMLFDTEGLIKYVIDLKTVMSDIHSIIAGEII